MFPNPLSQFKFTPSLLALTYCVFGFGLLVFSDVVLVYLVKEPFLSQLQGLKGLLEVLLTALFLYGIARIFWNKLNVKNQMIHDATVGITMIDPATASHEIEYVNSHFESMTDHSADSLRGEPFHGLWGEETAGQTIDDIKSACTNGNHLRVEVPCEQADGNTFTDWVELFPIERGGSLLHMVAFHRNISKLHQLESQLRESLDEQKTLLKEVHHRVKNNLQILVGLLGLQVRESDDPRLEKELNESKRRIHSMALIHEKLYERPALKEVDFQSYVEELVQEVVETVSYGDKEPDVTVRINSESMVLDRIIPCGIVINELVSNSIEHGIPENGTGEIQVKFGRENSHYRLVITDNGPGMSREELEKHRSLGMRLVQSLVTQQLDGTLEFNSENGMKTIITFPIRDPLKTSD